MCADSLLNKLNPRFKRIQQTPRFLSFFALLLFSACMPGITPVARPTPVILAVQITPALQSMTGEFQDCARNLPGVSLVLLNTPTSAINLDTTPLALRWGTKQTPGSFAAVVGNEDLVVIAHPQNPIQQISLEDLQAIYRGTQSTWKEPASGEIHAWAYPEGEDAQDAFETAVISGKPISPRATSIAPDSQAMRQAISADVASIGFLPRRWVDSQVKVLSIQGIDTAKLRQPILALSKTEPQGVEKSWLICLQGLEK